MKKTTEIIGYKKIEGYLVPIIKTKLDKNKRTCYFYCEFCKQEHNHGAMRGTRVSHCHNPDCSWGKEYFIEYDGDSIYDNR